MDPIEFVDNISSKQHILQVITNENEAKQVQFRFIGNGLLKQEHCIYMTHESPEKIKQEMIENGIDVEKFTNNSLLKIYKVPDILKDPDGPLEGFKKMFADMTAGPPPQRIVGRSINDISTENGMAAQIEIEKYAHSVFDSLDSSILCCYDFLHQRPAQNNALFMRLCDCHHNVIMSMMSGSFAFNLHGAK
ncbi:MAG: MEDS domain-containing protein [Thaumarchaeota archaeon]|nr:MEDS domain-containing protein [Nitrososphaerota archaeon]